MKFIRSRATQILAGAAALTLTCAIGPAPASASLPGGGGASCIAFLDFTQPTGQIKETVSFRNCYGWWLDGYSEFTSGGTTYKHDYDECNWTRNSDCVSSHTFANPSGKQNFHWQTVVRLCFPGGCDMSADGQVYGYDEVDF